MEDYKYRPLDGLLEINRTEINNSNLVRAFDYAEEKIKPSPSGRAKDLAILFHLIKIFKDLDIKFYVKGGVILQYYLKDKARVTHDLDIITMEDADAVFNKLEKALKEIKEPLTYKVSNFSKSKAHEGYYYDNFNIVIEVLNNNEPYSKVAIDAVVNEEIFNHIVPKTYQGPEFVSESLSFKGVPIEYVTAEKIIAITNELERPYKHLIDAYSLIHINMCIGLLKEYLDLIIKNDNQVRIKLNKEVKDYVYQIKDDKRFVGTQVLPALQAGYVLSFEDMKEEVNKWMRDNL